MPIKIYKPGESPPSYRRIALYGDPKIGKTRLGTSLPWGKYGWGEKAAYVGWGDGTLDWEHSPILLEDRAHLIPAHGISDVDAKGKETFDPMEAATELAVMDWKAVDPEIGTIIWDTMTETSTDFLNAIAHQGRYGNSISFGKPGTDSYVVHPGMGDYGAAQRYTDHIIDFLFSQPLNVIVLFHARATDSDDADQVGGPAGAGKAGIRPTAGRFDNLFRIATKRERIGIGTPPKYENKRVVFTEPEGVWLAGARSAHKKNPMGTYVLTEDTHKFWEDLERVQKESS